MKKSSTFSFLDALSSNLKCCLFSKGTISKLNFLRFDVRMMVPFIFMAMMFMYNTVNAQFLGKAPVQTPVTGFEIDGNAYAHEPIGTAGDWFDSDLNHNHGLLHPTSGAVLYPGKTFIIRDRYLDDLTIFTSSNKINDNPNTYTWGPGSSPNKDEIQNVGVHFTYGDPNIRGGDGITGDYGNTNDLWCLFAGDRQVTNGSSYIDFEFLQMPMTITGATYGALDPTTGVAPITGGSGTFVSQGISGGRTLGDLLITIELTNGGGAARVEINVWEQLAGGGFGYVIHPNSEYIGNLFITENNSL